MPSLYLGPSPGSFKSTSRLGRNRAWGTRAGGGEVAGGDRWDQHQPYTSHVSLDPCVSLLSTLTHPLQGQSAPRSKLLGGGGGASVLSGQLVEPSGS